MISLKDRKWKEFFIEDIFFIKSGKRLVQSNSVPGEIPFVRALDSNNGVADFVSNINSSMDSNVLGVNYDGSVCETFYHPYKAIFSDSVKRLRLKFDLQNEYIYLFLKNAIINQRNKYNYAYKFNEKRMERQYIMLPVTDEGEPDWIFMQDYIKQLESNQKEEYKNFATKKLQDLEYKEIPTLKEKTWKAFFIEAIANIESGHDIYEAERTDGDTPYITSSSINNGIKYFVSNTNKTKEANAISVNRNGSVGYSFYHKYSALYSNDCRKLKLKDSRNEYVSLFITNQITNQKEKYSYGYKMGTARLKRQYIMLPVNSDNEPDYDYMEQYIKNVMYKQLTSYLEICK